MTLTQFKIERNQNETYFGKVPSYLEKHEPLIIAIIRKQGEQFSGRGHRYEFEKIAFDGEVQLIQIEESVEIVE